MGSFVQIQGSFVRLGLLGIICTEGSFIRRELFGPNMGSYRALHFLSEQGSFVRIWTLLSEYRALLSKYRALLSEYGLLFQMRALLSEYGLLQGSFFRTGIFAVVLKYRDLKSGFL